MNAAPTRKNRCRRGIARWRRGRRAPPGCLRREKLDGGGVELGETLHGEVLLIVVRLDHQTLRALHHVENVGLELFGAVGAHAEVELVGVGGFAKGDGHAEDGVGGRLVDVGEEGTGGGDAKGRSRGDAVGLKRRTRKEGQAGARGSVARAPRQTDLGVPISGVGSSRKTRKSVRARTSEAWRARMGAPTIAADRAAESASMATLRGIAFEARGVVLDWTSSDTRAPRKGFFFTTAPQPSTTRSFFPRERRFGAKPPACAINCQRGVRTSREPR